MSESRLEWCGEAEPKLLKLRARLRAEKVTPAEAYSELVTLVGRKRFDADWLAAQAPCPPQRSPQLWAVEQWDNAHPRGDLKHRLYQSDCLLIMLAAELGLSEYSKNLIGERHNPDGTVIPEAR